MNDLDRSKDLLIQLNEIEESIISNDKLKSLIVTAWKQLNKIFGEDWNYKKYIKEIDEKNIKSEEQILQDFISTNNKWYITSTNGITDYKTIDIYRNTLLIKYLIKNKLVSDEEIKEIQKIFSKSNGNIAELLNSEKDNPKVKDALEKYVNHMKNNKNFLITNQHDIIDSFENMRSLQSVLWHELAHHIFKRFTRLSWNWIIALNEAYSFALQKFLNILDKEIITYNDIKKEILWLYKIIEERKYVYKEKDYLFMRSFIPLIWWLVAATIIGMKESSPQNQELFNKSYSQDSYYWLFTIYDESINNIKDPKIKELLQSVKKTSIHQLQKSKKILNQSVKEKTKEIYMDAYEYIDGKITKDSFKWATKMLIHELELLSMIEDRGVINNYKNDIFLVCSEILDEMKLDEEQIANKNLLYENLKDKELKFQEIIDLINKV